MDLKGCCIPRRTAGKNAGMRLIGAVVSRNRAGYAAFVLITFVVAAVSLLPAELFRFFTTHLSGPSSLSIDKLASFGFLVALGMMVATFLGIISREWIRLVISSALREQVMQRLHSVQYELFDSARRGEWLTRMTDDLRSVESFMAESVPEQLRSAAVLTGAGTLFLVHFGWIALVPLSAALVVALVNVLVQRRIAPVLNELRDINANILQMLMESFEGRRTIRSCQAQAAVQSSFRSQVRGVYKRGMSVVKWLGLLLSANQLASTVMVTLCLSAGFWQVATGKLAVASALVVPFYIGMFFASAQSIASHAYSWNRFIIEGGRLATFLEQPTEANETLLIPVDELSAIELHDLITGVGQYRADPVSQKVSLGELILLQGASGSGKSTLFETIAGLRVPISGQWHLHSKGGVTQNLTAKISTQYSILVEQHPYLLTGSVLDNLSLGRDGGVAPETAWQVLQSVGLADALMQRGGLHTSVGDLGDKFSAGQRYRLGLARALLSEKPILLVDEPYAAVDAYTAEAITGALNLAKKHKAVLVISHTVPDGLHVDRMLDMSCESSMSDEKLSGRSSGFANFSQTADMLDAGRNHATQT